LKVASVEKLVQQKPYCIWFTGLSGAGKTTLAVQLKHRLQVAGLPVYHLDGDKLRDGINQDLGFSVVDRTENIRRISEIARLMMDAGLIVLVSCISPYRTDRHNARQLFDTGQFIEIYVNTPLAECERRDVKGLYAKARRGEITEFTAIDSPYEPPRSPEMQFNTTNQSVQECVELILSSVFTK
jgi:bifunctional enzyme CysN/CysC